jgi:hypothetical protein
MVLVVTVLAIALRIAWVLLVPSKPVGDFAMYVESAAHLVAHGRFDPQFVYMPGYILLIAPIQALGGGLGAGAVAGIASSISGGSQRVTLFAGLLCACWPAGIAVASVTGTDMPAAALTLIAAYVLWRYAGTRPLLAAILFGALTGLAAYIRAILVPLAALSGLVFRASGKPWRRSLALAALACGVALLTLAPWAVRNRLRYGETFFTDSHGGLTALVGANPNTDGCYSRSLNRMFRDVTGFKLLAKPHRQADRAALDIAKTWMAFDPLYTLGLLIGKAERLLLRERALLYWPIYRAAVLTGNDRLFFASHQVGIEALADTFWLTVLALALAGCGIAYARRQWLALALLPPAMVLAGLYAAIFAEGRYRLPISMMLMPLSALALDWLVQTARQIRGGPRAPTWRREAVFAVALPSMIFMLVPALGYAGERLRTSHRWAVHECEILGHARFCSWRTVENQSASDGASGLKGVWNGVGFEIPAGSPESPGKLVAETRVDLPAGDYRITAESDLVRAASPEATLDGTLSVLAKGRALSPPLSLARLPDGRTGGAALKWQAPLHHDGGLLDLRAQVETPAGTSPSVPGRVWFMNLRFEREPAP